LRFKDVISDLSIEKQKEMIAWKKKYDNRSAIIITVFVIFPIEILAFVLGHYFGGWLH